MLADWKNSGLYEGDTVLVHSDIRRTIFNYQRRKKNISPQLILKSLIEAVGREGTLILPTFNFDFSSKASPFDIANTPSQMGILTEVARMNPNFTRTKHPVYSFAVFGKHKDVFKKAHNSHSYSEDSPFGILKRLNGKIASLNLDELKSMTFYHHIEEVNNIDYRYHKNFSGKFINDLGESSDITISIFVRNLKKGVVTHLNPAGELLWTNGLYSGYKPNEGTGMRIINAQNMFDFVTKEIINKNKAEGLLYRIEK